MLLLVRHLLLLVRHLFLVAMQFTGRSSKVMLVLGIVASVMFSRLIAKPLRPGRRTSFFKGIPFGLEP